MCENHMPPETSNVIALIALLVSVLSALYARWSGIEAKRSNEFARADNKKQIYDAFFELKMHMTQKAEMADAAEVSKFFYHRKNSHLYLSDDLANKISKYHEACFWIANINRRGNGHTAESLEECKPYLEVEKNLSIAIEKELSELIKAANA